MRNDRHSSRDNERHGAVSEAIERMSTCSRHGTSLAATIIDDKVKFMAQRLVWPKIWRWRDFYRLLRSTNMLGVRQ
jgi:hypothetical protein